MRRLVGLVALVAWLLAGKAARADEAVQTRGSARLVLIPFLDGEPWALPPDSAATVVLIGNFPMRAVDTAPTSEGLIEVGDLSAGESVPSLRVRYEKDDPRSVCHGPEEAARVSLEEGRSTRRVVPLRCDVHIREPPARRKSLFAPLSSPVTLEWAPVPRAVRYGYELRRVSGPASGSTETVARGETEEASVKMPLDPSLLDDDRYELTVSAHGTRDEIGRLPDPYVFRVAGGTPEPGTANARLVPIFDGLPLAWPRDIPTTVRLSRPGSADKREILARFADGAIELTGIETGIYDVVFWLDLKHPHPGPPDSDDYLITAVARPLALLHDGETVRREIVMHAALELLSPPDIVLRPGRPRAPVIRSPVHAVWKPVRGAVRYRVVLKATYADAEEPPRDLVTETSEPSWTAELPPGEFYLLIIEAHGARAVVGSAFVDFAVEDSGPLAPTQ